MAHIIQEKVQEMTTKISFSPLKSKGKDEK